MACTGSPRGLSHRHSARAWWPGAQRTADGGTLLATSAVPPAAATPLPELASILVTAPDLLSGDGEGEKQKNGEREDGHGFAKPSRSASNAVICFRSSWFSARRLSISARQPSEVAAC